MFIKFIGRYAVLVVGDVYLRRGLGVTATANHYHKYVLVLNN